MSKSILLSIQPKWVVKILNGEKTIEVRKRFPKDYVGWVYIYCTKGKQELNYHSSTQIILGKTDLTSYRLNGKVVARFYCDKVEEISAKNIESFTKDSCLTVKQIEDYLWKNICNGYAIHISKLEIFDEPRELSEFESVGKKKNCRTCKERCRYYLSTNTLSGKPNSGCTRYKRITKAPQNYLYIGGGE